MNIIKMLILQASDTFWVTTASDALNRCSVPSGRLYVPTRPPLFHRLSDETHLRGRRAEKHTPPACRGFYRWQQTRRETRRYTHVKPSLYLPPPDGSPPLRKTQSGQITSGNRGLKVTLCFGGRRWGGKKETPTVIALRLTLLLAEKRRKIKREMSQNRLGLLVKSL